jgi:hypothetical protein
MRRYGADVSALTQDAIGIDPKLWEKVDNGEYNIVYITPEMALDPASHFLSCIP